MKTPSLSSFTALSLKALVIIIGIISLGMAAQAQVTQTVRGSVIDVDTKQPLFGVNIVVLNSDPFIGATTDMDGRFRLENVPVGRHNIKVSYIGYRESTVSNLEINSGKETVLNLQLEESVTTLGEVEIVAEEDKRESLNEMATTSARQFSVEETGRYAGSRNDVSRMAANYAGVSNANDSRNDIVIRGNSPNGLLWRMEGLDIPSPNHFTGVGSNGGPISMLNYNVIDNSDFLTGAFPAEYGNATSGVFDIKLRNGNDEKREYMFQLGALGTEVMLEGPFSGRGKGSYLINYRFSTTTMLTAMGIDFGFSGQADYQDVSFKFNIPTKAGTFSLYGLAGNSIYKVLNSERDDDALDETITDNTNDKFTNRLGIIGLSHRYLISNNTFINTTIGLTGNGSIGEVDSVSTTDDERLIPYLASDSYQYRVSAHTYVKTKFNARNKLKVGAIIDQQSYALTEAIYRSWLNGLEQTFDADGNTYLVRAYAQWQHKLSDNLTLNTGIHHQQLLLNNATSIEPRAGIRWNFAPTQTMSVAYGLHSQMQILPTYFYGTITPNGLVNTNKNLDFTKSHHFVLGYGNALSEHSQLKVETYYQRLYDIPIHPASTPTSFAMINEGATFALANEDSLINNGTGQNIGLEITLERFFNRGYYYLFTTSLFDSKYTGSDGVERNTAFNGNYVSNLLLGKEFKVGENNKIIVDLKVSMAGGRRYTPIDLEASRLAGEAVEIDRLAYTEQHDPYFRTDFKITYRINKQKLSHEVFFNIDNVFNNQNIFLQTYNARNGTIGNIYQLGMFPTFQYKILF